VIIAQPQALAMAVKRVASVKRLTSLRHRLRAMLAGDRG
jgi:hypothetical protein